ncbi:TniQ family protein [Brevibacterium sp. BDJS002]|uniref:TniQ family protein n=1 Tax=Brevibacterium sp. BDJS002 TaxID=3020906 RepID=UPI002307E222|nr:TniQ family protein [Brevibacterium sp. BDJS002]WCE41882.1 TniQ family protein [Brevibacterium sp. BDJS002]
MTTRWPLHPRPIVGEALTSWLYRLADCHTITVDSLTFDLGHCVTREDDLDLDPPQGLVEQLAIRTGVSSEQIQSMSISGYTPWLLDTIDPDPDTFTTYTRQQAILLPERNVRSRTVDSWRAWVPLTNDRHYRSCPQCSIESSPPRPYLLTWSLPLMLTCPFHHCRLEHHNGSSGYYAWGELSPVPEPEEAPPAIRRMDIRTWQALTTGFVDLPRHRIHAGRWFRLLRTLIDELGATMGDCGAAQRLTRKAWERSGHPVRAGQAKWRPFETLTPQKQEQTLEAAAVAMCLLENDELTGQGREAGLFLPEPDASIDPGQPQRKPAPSWQPKSLGQALHDAVEEAKANPDSARQLFDFITLYRHDDEYVGRVRGNFAELGIRLDDVSQ